MPKQEGWIKLYRKLTEHELWLSGTFSRGQAWVDLLLLANHADGHIWVRGIKVPVLRGQIGWSELRLSKRWKWSRSKVKHFILGLQSEQQIEQQINLKISVLTIVNYDQYQQIEQQNEQENEQQKDNRKTTERQQKDTNKKDKNEKKKEKEEKEEKKTHAEFVTLTEREYQTLVGIHGEETAKRMIGILNNFKGSKDKTYKSDYYALCGWVTDKIKKERGEEGSSNGQPRRSSRQGTLQGDGVDLGPLIQR